MAPSTIGTFLRCFTFGHIRQLDAVADRVLQRAWGLGAGPASDEALVIDVDSTITEVHGHHKQGVAYGYTKQLGYHPLLATRAGTGEVLHARVRKGSAGSARGVVRFVDEFLARLRRAGADGQITLRADSGFWSWNSSTRSTATACCGRSPSPSTKRSAQRSRRSPSRPGATSITRSAGSPGRRVRLHHAFITNTGLDAVAADAFHRNHAVVELAIRDLKEGAGLEHCPSGHYSANAAWLACAVLAHNLGRWTSLLGDTSPDRVVWTHATMRTRLITLAATLVNRSGHLTLRLPLNWPWATKFTDILNALRTLPAPSG